MIPYYGPSLGRRVSTAPKGARSSLVLPDTLQPENNFTVYVSMTCHPAGCSYLALMRSDEGLDIPKHFTVLTQCSTPATSTMPQSRANCELSVPLSVRMDTTGTTVPSRLHIISDYWLSTTSGKSPRCSLRGRELVRACWCHIGCTAGRAWVADANLSNHLSVWSLKIKRGTGSRDSI